MRLLSVVAMTAAFGLHAECPEPERADELAPQNFRHRTFEDSIGFRWSGRADGIAATNEMGDIVNIPVSGKQVTVPFGVIPEGRYNVAVYNDCGLSNLLQIGCDADGCYGFIQITGHIIGPVGGEEE